MESNVAGGMGEMAGAASSRDRAFTTDDVMHSLVAPTEGDRGGSPEVMTNVEDDVGDEVGEVGAEVVAVPEVANDGGFVDATIAVAPPPTTYELPPEARGRGRARGGGPGSRGGRTKPTHKVLTALDMAGSAEAAQLKAGDAVRLSHSSAELQKMLLPVPGQLPALSPLALTQLSRAQGLNPVDVASTPGDGALRDPIGAQLLQHLCASSGAVGASSVAATAAAANAVAAAAAATSSAAAAVGGAGAEARVLALSAVGSMALPVAYSLSQPALMRPPPKPKKESSRGEGERLQKVGMASSSATKTSARALLATYKVNLPAHIPILPPVICPPHLTLPAAPRGR